MSLMYINSKRSFLDRLKIPKKLRLKNYCCRLKSSFYCCMFMMWVIDAFVLLKYMVMFAEMAIYTDQYPWLVALDVSFKAFL